jgi:SAM-dependent methyltransferase
MTFVRVSENIYGSLRRLNWIRSYLSKEQKVVDFGCGTGVMITIPLAKDGYCVTGVDQDLASIEYGRQLLLKEGLATNVLRQCNLDQLGVAADTIIASEVLEHLPDSELSSTLDLIRKTLKPGGTLLISVPNGYGWFEFESFLWNKLRFDLLFRWTLVAPLYNRLKRVLLGSDFESPYPSTLSGSPHVQRFTFDSIVRLLAEYGFQVREITGSVLVCGPISNLFLTGIDSIMAVNARLGDRFPRLAAGFFVRATVPR